MTPYWFSSYSRNNIYDAAYNLEIVVPLRYHNDHTLYIFGYTQVVPLHHNLWNYISEIYLENPKISSK